MTNLYQGLRISILYIDPDYKYRLENVKLTLEKVNL